MMSLEELFQEALLHGECCSQIMLRVALDRLDRRNEDLIRSMFGLCEGTPHGGTCGLVSAAACIFSLACPREDALALIGDFNEWFEDNYGSFSCRVLTNGEPMKRMSFCRELNLACLRYIGELLEWDDAGEEP